MPITHLRFEVVLADAGMRLDAALRLHFPWKSRAHFQRMIDRGEATVNDGRRKASHRLRVGDVVAVKIPVPADAPAKESAEGLEILFEDDALVAIDKPAGVVAHPTGRIRHGTLINRLHARYRRTGDGAKESDGSDGADVDDAPAERDIVPRLAHRLDRDTSGVVLVVKDRRLDAVVTRAFHRREVRKTYLALVRGAPADEGGVIDLAIGPAPEAQTKLEMATRPDGRPSRTRWRVRERFAAHTLLEVEPLTGRTHQIRVHLRAIGFPIVADHLYGDLRPLRRSTIDPSVPESEDAIVLDRLALHARRLELRHPATGKPLAIESPVPADLERALEALRALDPATARRHDAVSVPVATPARLAVAAVP